MIKKIAYGIGGTFVFLYILGIFLPTVDPVEKTNVEATPVLHDEEFATETEKEKMSVVEQVYVQKPKVDEQSTPNPVSVKTEPVVVEGKAEEKIENTQSTPTQSSIETQGYKFYTSSHYTAKYYYPANCEEWNNLSKSYLKSFDSLNALLAKYPSRTLSPQCQ